MPPPPTSLPASTPPGPHRRPPGAPRWSRWWPAAHPPHDPEALLGYESALPWVVQPSVTDSPLASTA